MDEDHKKAFEILVGEYAPRLSNKIMMGGSVFTLHNFNEHCFNIYKMISNVLLDGALIYSGQYALSQTELYILNIAVLFHDIGMSECLIGEREDHSLRSAEFVEKEWKNKESTLAKYINLTSNEIEALKIVIVAHSDVKNGIVNPKENGLNNRDLDKKMWDKNGKKIRTRFLAGVLRVGDELDITSERLGNSNIEQSIEFWIDKIDNTDDPVEKQKAKKMAESLNHWKKLHLISYVRREENSETISVIVDDKAVYEAYNSGESMDSIADTLLSILDGVEKKLNEAHELCFSNSDLKKSIAVRKIRIRTEVSELDTIMNKMRSRKSFPRVAQKNEVLEVVEEKNIEKKKIPYVIDKELEIELSKEVEKRKLISFGHFRLTQEYCARDWIDTKELVETRAINKKIVRTISQDILDNQFDFDYVVVGVGLVGTILAARVAFSLQCPLSYIITEKDIINNSNHETKIILPDRKKLILITDVIVTYESINNLMKQYYLGERVVSVYSVFYRNSDVIKENKNVSITRCLNAKYDIELFRKSECKYKDKCIAINQTVNSINDSVYHNEG